MKIILALIFAGTLGTLIFFGVNCATTGETAASGETQTNMIYNSTEAKPDEKRVPVIVELFTSEGCSSCPPADANLKMLLETQPIAGAEIIALSQHVDYWNRLGWADPFSHQQFSQRQGEYSNFFGSGGNVYTPQMIVDGRAEFVGGNMREALKQIAAAVENEKGAVSLAAEKAKDDISLAVKIENLPKTVNDSIVLLAIAENDLTSSVGRGENAGRKLTHVAVVRHLTNIGTIKAGEKSFELKQTLPISKNWKIENSNAVVFAQDVKTRQIYAAGKVDF